MHLPSCCYLSPHVPYRYEDKVSGRMAEEDYAILSLEYVSSEPTESARELFNEEHELDEEEQ